jgi:hypothetical protein
MNVSSFSFSFPFPFRFPGFLTAVVLLITPKLLSVFIWSKPISASNSFIYLFNLFFTFLICLFIIISVCVYLSDLKGYCKNPDHILLKFHLFFNFTHL